VSVVTILVFRVLVGCALLHNPATQATQSGLLRRVSTKQTSEFFHYPARRVWLWRIPSGAICRAGHRTVYRWMSGPKGASFLKNQRDHLCEIQGATTPRSTPRDKPTLSDFTRPDLQIPSEIA
jgi:hypothetical protein